MGLLKKWLGIKSNDASPVILPMTNAQRTVHRRRKRRQPDAQPDIDVNTQLDPVEVARQAQRYLDTHRHDVRSLMGSQEELLDELRYGTADEETIIETKPSRKSTPRRAQTILKPTRGDWNPDTGYER